jgi:O-antigen/teichoic acid export membrane protein
MNQLRAGIILSYLALFLTNGISLVFTPYMLGKLGQVEYGLYALIGSLMGYLGLLTFGMSGTLIRYIARYRGTGEKEKEENLLAMALFVYATIALLVLVTGTGLWYSLSGLFPKLAPEELFKAKSMFAILVFSTSITLPGAVFVAIQTAYERFVFSRTCNIAFFLARTGILAILLFLGYKAITIVLVDATLALITLLVNIHYVFNVMKIRIRFHSMDIPLLREIFIFSFWMFLSMVIDQLYWKFGQTVLGITTGPAAVAIFAIAAQLAGYFIVLSTSVSNVFVPRAAIMETQHADGEVLTGMMIKVGRFQLMVMGLAFIGFICLGRLFLLNWLGSEYLPVWGLTLVMATPLLIPLMQNFGIAVLQAKNKHQMRALMYLGIAGISVCTGYWLSMEWGGMGMAIGTGLALLLGPGIAINLYYHCKIGLNIPRFFREMSGGLLPALLVSSGIGYVLATQLPGNGWPGFLYKGTLLVLAYAAIMWRFGMKKVEKDIIVSLLPSRLFLFPRTK